MTIGQNDYPLGNGGCSTASDPWGCEIRQCTSFCAWRCVHDFGLRGFRCPGNARVWGSWFAAHGYRVDTTPAHGAIACLQPGDNGTFSAGHVAIVLGVSAPNVVHTESYNWCNECCAYSQQTLAPNSSRRYIHVPIPGVAPAPVPAAPPAAAPPPPAPVPSSGDGWLIAAALVGGAALAGYAVYREHPEKFAGLTAAMHDHGGDQDGFG